ncbi:MAG TPA: holo-ACP synthase [Solirubrobacteraceae bacterium]|nr:holo-ACP synthase [Solirubrobacteraceae bacterium]
MNIGIDLVLTDEVRESMQIHGERYVKRVYTDAEQADCGDDPRLLASCFAAKEAAMKALGRGDEPLSWRSIGVRRDAGGHLSLELTGEAAALARRRGIDTFHLSTAYHRAAAAAIVLAEGRGAP